MRRRYLAVLCLLCLCSGARAAERAGNTVLLSIGYFTSVGERTEFAVPYIEPTWPSDDVTLGVTTEGPALWKSLYPLVDLKWRFGNRYAVESYDRYVDAHGVILTGGLGYSVPVWQATLRVEGTAGYSWETVDVHYGGSGLEPLALDNDQMKWTLGASLACPFANRVTAFAGYDFLFGSTSTLEGAFKNGRTYHLETADLHGTVFLGFATKFGAQ